MRLAAVTWLTLGAGCAGVPGPAATRHLVRGQLLAVQLDIGQVLVKHESIPGYMDAMTMPFRVADRTTIRDRRPGDLISATLVVESEATHRGDGELAGTAPLGDAAPAPPVAEGLPILAPGDTAPDTPLTTHRGATVALPKDRTVTHNLRTAVIAPDGRVAGVRSGNDWTTAELLADLRQALAESPTDR